SVRHADDDGDASGNARQRPADDRARFGGRELRRLAHDAEQGETADAPCKIEVHQPVEAREVESAVRRERSTWGARQGPPHPPTLGRAPAEPWRASGFAQ